MRIQREIEGDLLVLTNPDDGSSVTIREIVNGDTARIVPAGQLTMEMSNDLEDELISMALMCPRLVITMDRVESIANKVIRMMLEVQHVVDAKGGEMVLEGLSPEVYDLFEEMGLDGVLDIHRMEEASE